MEMKFDSDGKVLVNRDAWHKEVRFAIDACQTEKDTKKKAGKLTWQDELDIDLQIKEFERELQGPSDDTPNP